jgi:DNA-binding GntR family transcriptional regulator
LRLAVIARDLQETTLLPIEKMLDRDLALRDAGNSCHAQIVRALENRNVEAAVQAVSHHMRGLIEALAATTWAM